MWRKLRNPFDRKNPIRIDPPKPKTKLHRMGEYAAKKVIEYFDLDDIYTGVHVTPHPFVALTYAIDRQVLDYNDWGFVDIIAPGLLIGIIPSDGDYGVLDADAYTTAQSLAELIDTVVDDLQEHPEVTTTLNIEELTDFIYENYEDEILDICGYPSLDELEYFGIGFGGGNIGNLSSLEKVRNLLPGAVFDVVQGADLNEIALQLGLETIPQTRIMRNISDDEIVHIVVPAPYQLPQEHKQFEETKPYFNEIGDYVAASEYEIDVDRLNNLTLRDGTTIFEKPHDRDKVVWHGSGLEEMSPAIPGILTPQLQHLAREAGSALDEDELREQFEDEDGDEHS